MAYVSYIVNNPNELITKISEYVIAQGYEVVEPLMDDLNIYDMSTTDGKKFVFKDATGNYFINLRSANGYSIFGDNSTLDTTIKPDKADEAIGGVGCTISEGYSKTVRWFAQYHAPVKANNKNFYLGTGITMPIGKGKTDGKVTENYSGNYILYCNRVKNPDTLVFSLVKHVEGHWAYLCSTLVIGMLYKYATWTGGIFMSSNSDYTLKSGAEMFNNKHIYMETANPGGDDVITDSDMGVILGNGNTLPHTFLRIDIDSAPSRDILWACDVDSTEGTGKHLALPLKIGSKTPAIPNYGNMQSTSSLDCGSNCNTLNSITVNMPLYMAVKVDPDILGNYASVGYVNGVYFISSYNIQATETYEIDYPKSGELCQVFPLTCRRGKFGYDALSVKQEVSK